MSVLPGAVQQGLERPWLVFLHAFQHFYVKLTKVLSEINYDASIPAISVLNGNRAGISAEDFNLTPLGMELGEFMMDGDLVAMMDRQGLLATDSGTNHPA